MMTDFIEDFPAATPTFDFDLIAQSLVPLLRQDTKGALVLGIHGPWGSGKTTLMQAVRSALEANPGDSNPLFVDFNAWKFHEREALWRALILRLVAELRPLVGADAASGLDELERSLYQAFIVQEKGPWTVNWQSLVTEVITIALSVIHLDFVARALAGSASWVGRIFGKKKSDGIDEKAIEKLGGILERTTTNRQVDQVQSIEQFLERFRQVMDALKADKRRIYMLIDDLDRCLPEAALDIFESIKLFLDAAGCVFVVALDRDVIRKGLSLRYGGSPQSDALLIAPDEYIEKTISISYDLPRLSDRDAAGIIDDFQLPVSLSANEKNLMITALGTNPRRLKRFMNTLALQLRLAELAADHDRPVPGGLLDGGDRDVLARFIKLMLISYRYSGVFALSFDDQELLVLLQSVANQSINNPSVRKGALQHFPVVVRTLEADEGFWRLMRAQPEFEEHDATVSTLLRWFRHDAGVSGQHD
jgi:hypothetical protein